MRRTPNRNTRACALVVVASISLGNKALLPLLALPFIAVALILLRLLPPWFRMRRATTIAHVTTSRAAAETQTTLPHRLPVPRSACWAWPAKEAHHDLTVLPRHVFLPLWRSSFVQILCASRVQHSVSRNSLAWNACPTALRANYSCCSRALTDFRCMPALVASSSRV